MRLVSPSQPPRMHGQTRGDRAASTGPQVPPAPCFSATGRTLSGLGHLPKEGRQSGRTMPHRELQYRGYRIKLMPRHSGWRIRARPLSPDKPILADHAFVVAEASEDEAIEQAKRRLDRVLSV
jgi:hypothetical protein